MEVTRIFDLLDRWSANYVKEDALSAKENGEWRNYSTQEYVQNARWFSFGLLAMGLTKGDKIATLSNNRPEWNFIDMGISQIGGVHVPIYPTLSSDEYVHILSHSDAKMLILSDKLLHKKIAPIAAEIATVEKVYTIDVVEGVSNWSEIVELGKSKESEFSAKLEELKASVSVDDIASIIYTSGTTGLSKGVMLTHENIVSNFTAPFDFIPLTSEHRALSFLPLCHVYERMMNYLYQYKGVSIYYAQNMGTIVNDLKDIKPQGFATVPRLLEKVYDTIMGKANELTGVKKSLFDWAVRLGLKYKSDGANGWLYETQLKLANKLIFSKWREALGGNIIFVGSGGAALQARLARVFWAAQIPIQEGYGLTETSPLIAFNSYKTPEMKLGTVGPVMNGVQVKIAEDGEILAKGPNVMKGYYKNDELTAEVLKDGWFHTGDVGILEDGMYLKITDRKKEIFKMSSGKYVAPQVIENKFKESSLIEQLMVVGENEKFASALISPSYDFMKDFASKHNIEFQEKEELIVHPEILKEFQSEVRKMNKELGKTEEIKRFQLVKEEWTPDTGELSPTLKLKRKFISKKYEGVLDQIYRK